MKNNGVYGFDSDSPILWQIHGFPFPSPLTGYLLGKRTCLCPRESATPAALGVATLIAKEF
jgi:hypothetical protein